VSDARRALLPALGRASLPGMTRAASMGFSGLALVLLGCASGPHPAMQLAARDFKCPIEQLERSEIYPNKQRIEGCDKEAVYVNACGSDYGTDAECGWAKAKPAY
jgi:hypothetical protein